MYKRAGMGSNFKRLKKMMSQYVKARNLENILNLDNMHLNMTRNSNADFNDIIKNSLGKSLADMTNGKTNKIKEPQRLFQESLLGAPFSHNNNELPATMHKILRDKGAFTWFDKDFNGVYMPYTPGMSAEFRSGKGADYFKEFNNKYVLDPYNKAVIKAEGNFVKKHTRALMNKGIPRNQAIQQANDALAAKKVSINAQKLGFVSSMGSNNINSLYNHIMKGSVGQGNKRITINNNAAINALTHEIGHHSASEMSMDDIKRYIMEAVTNNSNYTNTVNNMKAITASPLDKDSIRDFLSNINKLESDIDNYMNNNNIISRGNLNVDSRKPLKNIVTAFRTEAPAEYSRAARYYGDSLDNRGITMFNLNSNKVTSTGGRRDTATDILNKALTADTRSAARDASLTLAALQDKLQQATINKFTNAGKGEVIADAISWDFSRWAKKHKPGLYKYLNDSIRKDVDKKMYKSVIRNVDSLYS